ncbi:metallophosphoesterase [Mesorhizobium sp. M0047]|uniref:metallophosphoesterase n=1 Tax=Mesorhizobium sp. M0047 TaxID=2956859 RepID=UPI00333AC887
MLHISDIHFKAPDCLDPWMDPDASIRTRMMRDLGEQVGKLGEVGAILIGGDVAFKGASEEYDTARGWIQQLSQISGCPKERVFVVPGNHDVDRGMIKKAVAIQNVQHAIASAPAGKREWKLSQQLRDRPSGQNLFEPHAAYNEFAAPFNCQIWPDKPFWHQDVPLGGGVNLRLYGLTSTLLSGQEGEDDKAGDLYLSPLQTVLNPVPNTINLVLVHHPVDWLFDGDAVDDALTSRAILHLFGHKHRQRAVMEANYVRLGAGAVNPSRHDKPYDPGYNLIRLEVEGNGHDRRVKVEVHQRRLQENPEMFVPIFAGHGKTVFESIIQLPEEAEIPRLDVIKPPAASAAGQADKAGDEIAAQDAEAALGDEDKRDLLYRFWSLKSGQRRDIVNELGLLEEGEMKLPEPERYGRALIRAGQRKLLDKVAAAVAKLEN